MCDRQRWNQLVWRQLTKAADHVAVSSRQRRHRRRVTLSCHGNLADSWPMRSWNSDVLACVWLILLSVLTHHLNHTCLFLLKLRLDQPFYFVQRTITISSLSCPHSLECFASWLNTLPHHWYLQAPSQDTPFNIAYQCCHLATAEAFRLRNDLLCVEWDVKLY